MTDLPRKAVVRTAKLATLPIGVAGRTALGVGKRIGGRPAEAVAAEMQARTAQQLFSVLGQLKGGAMKFGQALSILEAALPEDLAGPYRETLTKLQDSAPALPAGTVHEVLRQSFGPQWRRMFVSFDDKPVAAASIGQVHRAVFADGRDVAVKVQYPGAADALMSDLTQLSRVLRVSASWLPGIELAPILQELRDRMAEEVDYRLEAQHQEGFAVAFDGDERVRVPHVLAHDERVIISEWIDGTPLSRVIADGTPEQRDAVGLDYLEFLLTGPAKAGMLHADPHPGNFRLLDDGRLGVLDFGAVNRLPDGMPPAIGELLTLALVVDDADGVVEGLRAAGFIRPGMKIDADRLLGFLDPFLEPLRSEEFRFDRAWLRRMFATANDPRRPEYLMGFRLNLPPEYVLIHRTWAGGLGVLAQIGATVPARALVDAYLPGADLPQVGT